MNHCGTRTIETEHLLLRRFTVGDAEPMFRNWASDPEVTKYLMWKEHADSGQSAEVLTQWVGQYENDAYYQWAITVKDEGPEPVGCISVVHQDDEVGMAHIGYCIGRKWWHRGIMSEALQAVMDYLFDVVGMNRIESRHDPRNPNSGRVMRKCGMHYEGTMKQADRNNQGICGACYYALVASDRKAGGNVPCTVNNASHGG